MINSAFMRLLCGVVGAGLLGASGNHANGADGNATTVSALAKQTHFHGIAVDQRDPSRLYLATHHGVYSVLANGVAARVSETRDDFMGFTPHPSDPKRLYASGHPQSGGNLGFLTSTDGGRTWIKLSDGLAGPVDFHQMDASKVDPKVIYGIYRILQRSDDGGHSWTHVGAPPQGVVSLAASSLNIEFLYAATLRGLLKSTDGGRTWDVAHTSRPATMVYVTAGGDIYSFVVGAGLIQAKESDLEWRVVSNGFGEDHVLHLAPNPLDGRQLYAVTFNPNTKSQLVQTSRDGGRNWALLGGR